MSSEGNECMAWKEQWTMSDLLQIFDYNSFCVTGQCHTRKII